MKRIFAVAIVAAMISVSFAIITPQTAKGEFIEELEAAPWGTTFTPMDVVFDDSGQYCVMVGQETGTGLSNAWGYDVFSDAWYPLDGAPLTQILKSVCYNSYMNKFMLSGDMGGTATDSVYYVDKGTTNLVGMGLNVSSTAIASDEYGNILVGGTGGALHSYDWMKWYNHSLGTDFNITAIAFNQYDLRFYLTAYDNFYYEAAIFYTDPATLNETSAISQAVMPYVEKLNGIAWNPTHNYGLAVGVGVYRVESYQGGLGMSFIGEATNTTTFYDVAWDSDGWDEAAIFGQDAGTARGVYYRYYDSNPTLLLGHQDATSSIYRGGCFKPPASPKLVFAPTPSGGILAHVESNDQSTRITANAVFPKLRWIGFNNSIMDSRMDQQVVPDANYYFTMYGNYSEGWANTEVIVEAWYDNGFTGTNSNYPNEEDKNRTLAFRISYLPSLPPSTTVLYPGGGPEITCGAATDTDHGDNIGDQSNHTVQIPVWLGPQTRAADGTGFGSGDAPFDMLKNNALQDANSWDFSITLRDATKTSAANTSYGEFGIEQLVSVSVTGNPTANAPPGTNDNLMTTYSQITYSANTNYWVNVSIPHLYLDGDPLATEWISANNVSVRNRAPNNVTTDTYIEDQTYFPATQNVGMSVWGLNGTALPPNGNGTVSVGRNVTDYNAAGLGYVTYTELEWWVTVPAGKQEGIYWGQITINIDGI